MRLVGISGKAGTGKTSTALFLAAHSRVRAKMISFADRLKVELAEHIGCHQNLFKMNKNDLLSVEQSLKITSFLGMPYKQLTKRAAMQLWGGHKRSTSANYWVDKALDDFRIFKEEDPNGLAIFHDVRFPNEANALRREGAALVRLQPWSGWIPGDRADDESEMSLDDYAFFDLVFRPEKGGIQEVAEAIYLHTMAHPTSIVCPRLDGA